MQRKKKRVHIPQRTTQRRNSNSETTSYSSWQCKNEISVVYIQQSILFFCIGEIAADSASEWLPIRLLTCGHVRSRRCSNNSQKTSRISFVICCGTWHRDRGILCRVRGCGMIQSDSSMRGFCGDVWYCFHILLITILNVNVLYSVTSPLDVDCFLLSFAWARWLHDNESGIGYVNMCIMMLCTIGCRNIDLYCT